MHRLQRSNSHFAERGRPRPPVYFFVTTQADREPSRLAARSRLRKCARDLSVALLLWLLRAGTARGPALHLNSYLFFCNCSYTRTGASALLQNLAAFGRALESATASWIAAALCRFSAKPDGVSDGF